jgi:O-acetyl-ADP-ribose deacetylase (regulator of RNase III)
MVSCLLWRKRLDPRIRIVQGDITACEVDAVVNAANEGLTDGGGVNGAIHRAAGPGLDEECRRIGGCPTGEARITGGYGLPARWIIHTVGPVWRGGDHGEDGLLAHCYRASLKLARVHGVRTIAFPVVSAGIFGYPFDRAVRVALSTIDADVGQDERLLHVSIVCFGEDAYSRCLAVSHAMQDAPPD